MCPYLATNMDIFTKQAIELGRAFDAGKQNASEQNQSKTAPVEVPTMDELTKIIAREMEKLKESIKGTISSQIALQVNNTPDNTQQSPTYTPSPNSNYRGNNFNSNYRGGRRGTHGRGGGNYRGANNNANGTYFTQPQQTTDQREQYYNTPNHNTPNPQPFNNNPPNFNPPFYNIDNNAPPYPNAPNNAQNASSYPNTPPQNTQNSTQNGSNYNRGGLIITQITADITRIQIQTIRNNSRKTNTSNSAKHLKQPEQPHQPGKLSADGVNGTATPSNHPQVSNISELKTKSAHSKRSKTKKGQHRLELPDASNPTSYPRYWLKLKIEHRERIKGESHAIRDNTRCSGKRRKHSGNRRDCRPPRNREYTKTRSNNCDTEHSNRLHSWTKYFTIIQYKNRCTTRHLYTRRPHGRERNRV